MFDFRSYNREWMRRRRAEEKRRQEARRGYELILQGKCPVTEILLTSKYHDVDCKCGIHLVPVVVEEITIYFHTIPKELQ